MIYFFFIFSRFQITLDIVMSLLRFLGQNSFCFFDSATGSLCFTEEGGAFTVSSSSSLLLFLHLSLLTGHRPFSHIVDLTRNCKPVTSSLSRPVNRIVLSVCARVKNPSSNLLL